MKAKILATILLSALLVSGCSSATDPAPSDGSTP